MCALCQPDFVLSWEDTPSPLKKLNSVAQVLEAQRPVALSIVQLLPLKTGYHSLATAFFSSFWGT
jgi:hypothetical protein